MFHFRILLTEKILFYIYKYLLLKITCNIQTYYNFHENFFIILLFHWTRAKFYYANIFAKKGF